MTVTPEMLAVITTNLMCKASMTWRHDNVGTVTCDLISQEKLLAGIMPPDVRRLMDLLHRQISINAMARMTYNKIDIYVGGREIIVGKNHWFSSATQPGLFAKDRVPHQPEAHTQAANQVNALLIQMGHDPTITAKARTPSLNYIEDFETTMFTVETPEASGSYHLFGNYAHQPDEMRQDQSREIALIVNSRIQDRHNVLTQRREVEKIVAPYLEKVEGMKVVGSVYQIDTYATKRNGILHGRAYAKVELTGNTLKTRIAIVDGRGDRKQLKHFISQHRANYKQLGNRTVDEALMCEPVLAAAIRSVVATYGADLLKEIEAVVAGKSWRSSNPIKRGIANISIKRGLVHAPVTLLKGKAGVRFMNDRLNVKSIKQMPQSVMQSLAGRALYEVIEHPFVKGLTIKSATVNKKNGLCIKPEYAPVPLATILRDLRKAIKQGSKP